MRSTVLNGIHIVFSGVFKVDNNEPETYVARHTLTHTHSHSLRERERERERTRLNTCQHHYQPRVCLVDCLGYSTKVWLLAEAFGAGCYREINERTTHVVAMQVWSIGWHGLWLIAIH
jgi:hypothetical protein